VQYKESVAPPGECKICNEERQYVNPNGQTWTTLEKMIETGSYKNVILKEEENLYSITTKPAFAIGQTAYLVQAMVLTCYGIA
jgi:D-arabinose 1-dehydrogenase-like Zn-dependent alcohol dehydrogenase